MIGNPALFPFAVTIFTEMSALARETGAINLGQGFPNFEGPAAIREAAVRALVSGHNQYAPSSGLAPLREAIADLYQATQGLSYDPVAETTVVAGATEGIAASLLGLLQPGQSVVALEPFYDCYPSMTALAGGVFRGVPVVRRGSRFAVDLDAVEAAIDDSTRVLLLNSPHNPSGLVLTEEELTALAALATRHDLWVVSDEVYEHLTFERPHRSIATLPGMRERTVVLGSASKSFSHTGWKVGWALAPAALTDALRRCHQFLTFCTPPALQLGVAEGLRGALAGDRFASFRAAYRARRDLLAEGLAAAGFEPLVPEGSYFILARTTAWTGGQPAPDRDFCRWLTREVGVCAIPPSSFYTEPSHGHGWARFAFCKDLDTLREASARLRAAWERGHRP